MPQACGKVQRCVEGARAAKPSSSQCRCLDTPSPDAGLSATERLLLLPAAGGPLAGAASLAATTAGGRGWRLALGGRYGSPGSSQRARRGAGRLLGWSGSATCSSNEFGSIASRNWHRQLHDLCRCHCYSVLDTGIMVSYMLNACNRLCSAMRDMAVCSPPSVPPSKWLLRAAPTFPLQRASSCSAYKPSSGELLHV